MKSNLMALSIFSLAISIVIGSVFIFKGLETIGYNQPSSPSYIELSTSDGDDYYANIKMLTVDDLANYLGISNSEVYLLSSTDHGQENPIPFIQIGETVYYAKEAVDHWLQTYESIIIE